MPEVDRVELICEDRRQEQFFRHVLAAAGLRVLSVAKPPAGRGSAAGWVLGQLPGAVRSLRSKSYQRGFGILLAIDGDAVGHRGRLAEIDDILRAHGLTAPDHLAFAIPTWSVETWILWLLDGRDIGEAASCKQAFEREFREANERAASV